MSKSKKGASQGAFAGLAAFREAKPSQLRTHVQNVRTKVLPKIKDQLKKKELGAERAKAYKVY